jgi:hypothetical protein
VKTLKWRIVASKGGMKMKANRKESVWRRSGVTAGVAWRKQRISYQWQI